MDDDNDNVPMQPVGQETVEQGMIDHHDIHALPHVQAVTSRGHIIRAPIRYQIL